MSTGSYALWRKNRQPNAGSSAVGTDLNRNWGFQWGCCGGSSGTFSSETYRGAAPFSAPETQRVRDFVQSRRRERRAADQDRHRLPHVLRARPVAVRLHDRRHDADDERRRPQHVRDARPEHGRHERLHARAGLATSTSPTARSTTGCGATRASSATRSRCTRRPRTRASTRPTRSSSRRRPATARPSCGCSRSPTARTAAIGKETQYCGVPSTTLFSRRLRDEQRLGREPGGHRDDSAAGSAAIPRRRPRAARSSSARRSPASTTS